MTPFQVECVLLLLLSRDFLHLSLVGHHIIELLSGALYMEMYGNVVSCGQYTFYTQVERSKEERQSTLEYGAGAS